jgi:methionyl-tRNA formyltransferase
MKIAIFFSDGLIGNVTLNRLVPQMIDIGIEPILFRSRGSNIARAKIPELQELSYLETGLLQDVVESILQSMPTFHRETSKKLCLTTKKIIEKYNLEFHDVDDVNNAEFISYLMNDSGIIGGISVRFYPKFKPEIIKQLNNKGFLWNLHTGLLPKYKGVFIPYRSIENNEEFYGWTLHEIANDIDTGAIIATDKLPLNPNKPVLDTYLDMTDRGVAMIMGALLFYQKRGELKGIPQVMDKDSYFTYPVRAEMQRWNNRGIIFADDIVKVYTDLFTVAGTVQETALRDKLIIAINATKQSQVA